MRKRSRITLFLLTVIMLLAVSCTAFASKRDKALNAYKKLLQKKTIQAVEPMAKKNGAKYATSKMKFFLMDVNNDSIPELLIDNTANKPLKEGYMLFSFKSGKAQEVMWIPSFIKPVRYYPKKMVLVSEMDYSGAKENVYSKLGKLTLDGQWKRIGVERHGEYSTTSEDGEYVSLTRKAFNERLKKCVGKTKAVSIQFRDNTAKNRKKYLK